MAQDETRIPVIVGVGQLNDRPADDLDGLDSVGLMAAALRLADRDAGGGWLQQVAVLEVVDQMSFPPLSEGLAERVAGALDIHPAHLRRTPDASGDGAVRLINDAANRIGAGQGDVIAICGGEGLRTAGRRAAAAAHAGMAPKWDIIRQTAEARRPPFLRKYGLLTPTEIYPFYEQATRARWGLTLEQAQRESAQIWSLCSEVSAQNPHAWIRKPVSADSVAMLSADNRPITHPYPKLMVANNAVNQGAALIVTSLAKARAAGIAEGRLVYVAKGAAAHEADDYLGRDAYHHSRGLQVSLTRALELNRLATGDLDLVELYSCFPCMPKMARRVLGWPLEKPVSVYGGLTFGGGPIGNCMTHAAAAMVEKLRHGAGTTGLIYANGGFATHSHSIVLTRVPQPAGTFPQDYDYQREADALRDPIPRFLAEYTGEGEIETYVVPYDRAGEPAYAAVVGRAPGGERFVTRVPKEDTGTLEFLTSGKREPVGTMGKAVLQSDGYVFWQPT